MGLPVFQAAGAWAESTSAAIAPAWPTHQAGDIALLFVHSCGWGINVSAPQGFKELPISPRWTSAGDPSTTTIQLNVFWKRAAGAAEVAPTVDYEARWRVDAGLRIAAVIVTYRGCGTGNPWNILGAADGYEAFATSLAIPGGVTTDANCLVVMAASLGGVNVASPITIANSSLASVTQRLTSTSTGRVFSLYTGTKVAAGTVDSSTCTAPVSRMLAGFMIALTGENKADDLTPYIAGCGPILESASANISPVWPAGHQANDIGILLIQSGGYPLTLGTPAGFTELPNSPQSSNDSGVDSLASLHAYWKRATTGAEATPTVNFHTDVIKAGIFIIRGAPTSGNFWDSSAGNIANPATTSVSYPSVTPAKVSSLILYLMTHGNDSDSRNQDPNGLSNANVLDRRLWSDFVSNVGTGCALVVSSARAPATGAIGATTNTMDAGQQQARMTLSIPPPGEFQTILSAGGTFSFSGQPSSLFHSRKLASAQGAFSFTGQDSALTVRVSHRLVSDVGLFGFQGQDSVLKIKEGVWTHEVPVETIWTKEPPA